MFNQKGVAHILLLIAALGLIAFLLISNIAPLKDKLLSTIFPKPTSHAADDKQPKAEFLSNQLLIKVKKEARGKVKGGNPHDTGIDSLNNINKEHNIKGFEKIAKEGKNSNKDAEVFGWYKVTLDQKEEKLNSGAELITSNIQSGQSTSEDLLVLLKDLRAGTANNKNKALLALHTAAIKLKSDPNIEAVEPNFIVHTTLIPNDPYYSSTGSWGQTYPDLWGMKKINAASAWDQTTGSANIVVASIDTGVDRNHGDLQGNMWVNTAEVLNNGIDDDHNGYVDDYYGWNFSTHSIA